MFHRGEIWIANLDPTQGHEQGKTRPCLIISVDGFNNSPADMVVVAPLTRTNRKIPLHVELLPPEGGVTSPSYILCDQIRTISATRVKNCLGQISDDTMLRVEKRLQQLLGL